MDNDDSFTVLFDRLTQRPVTRKGYQRSILSLGLSVPSELITQCERVLSYIRERVSIHELSNTYSAIVAYLRVMNPIPETTIEFYRTYFRERLDDIMTMRRQYRRDQHRNNGYTYVSLRQKVQSLIPRERNAEHRLLMSLFVNIPPRRTSDYVNLHLNIADDDVHNILIFTPERKTFIFNDWKAATKKGKQIIDISNSNLIDDIQTYISSYPDTRILFEHDCSWISSASALIRKKHDIPFSVYDIRHMFSTYINDEHLSEYHKSKFAEHMGTSVEYMNTAYDDGRRDIPSNTVDIDDLIRELN